MLTLEKAKSFVYYGAEYYITIKNMQRIVPSAYLFFAILSVTAGIAGKMITMMIVSLVLILIYAVTVYTLPCWCPRPSFITRFTTNAFCMISLSVVFQISVYMVLVASEYIEIFEIVISVTMQILSVVANTIIITHKIKAYKYRNKKEVRSGKTTSFLIASAASGYVFVRLFLGNIAHSTAIIIINIIIIVLSVLFLSIASFNLIKVYCCRKYRIVCDENGENSSPQLIK